MTHGDSCDGPGALERRIAGLISEKFLEVPGELAPDADLFALGFDSMGIMQLIVAIEELFGARVPAEAVTQGNFRTPSRIAELVRKITAGAL